MRRLGLAILPMLSGGAALAADMPGTMPPPRDFGVVQTEYAPSPLQGYYVRGDLGYAWGRMSGAENTSPFANPTNTKLGNGFVGGVGAGYKSTWFRTDLTLDYTGSLKFEGTQIAPGDTSAKVSAVSALLNGYLDLGTWYRMTPYMGAGVGATQVHVSGFTAPAGRPGAGANGGSNTRYNFAYALMAGVGYSMTRNLMIDAGYRYMNFGDALSPSDAFGNMTLKNLAAHEVRVGIRWSFDDLAFPR